MNKWLILLSLFLLSSCIDPPPVRLSKANKEELKSQYEDSLDSLDILAEEICDEKKVSIYQAAIDSIQNVRREEIESLIGQ